MIDMHYDLLTISYICYLNNDFTMLKKINKEIKNNNVKYIFANLCFLDKETMKKELHELYYQDSVSVIEMFKISINILNKYIKKVNFVYCIEGCGYLSVDDLDKLYVLGLKSIILTWNDKNIYGSGISTNKGLSKKGKKFINRAIDLNIGIDLSHTNLKTFNSILKILKKRKKSIYYISHSNIRALENRKRNLSNKQLIKLRKQNCKLGLFFNKNFIDRKSDNLKESYLRHIVYAVNYLGIDNVMISSDDMRFCSEKNPIYNDLSIFNYNNLYDELYKLLKTEYTELQVKKIMYGNAYQIVKKLK